MKIYSVLHNNKIQPLIKWSLSSIILSLALLFFVLPAHAVMISDIAVINNSSAEEATSYQSGRIHEFHTTSNVGDVEVGAGSLTFTSQMQWYNGHLATGGNAQVHKRNVNYDLLFTVNDDSNDGYTLNVDSQLRGYSTALWTSGTNANAVIATGTGFSGRIDTDTTDGSDTLSSQVTDLTILVNSRATANSATQISHTFKDASNDYLAGDFVGTRTFGLRFTTLTTPSTNVYMQNQQTGQGSVRYGLENLLNGLDYSGQPRVGDLTSDQLGHFVTINIISDNISSVPEPNTFAIWSLFATLGIFMVWRRKQRAA